MLTIFLQNRPTAPLNDLPPNKYHWWCSKELSKQSISLAHDRSTAGCFVLLFGMFNCAVSVMPLSGCKTVLSPTLTYAQLDFWKSKVLHLAVPAHKPRAMIRNKKENKDIYSLSASLCWHSRYPPCCGYMFDLNTFGLLSLTFDLWGCCNWPFK